MNPDFTNYTPVVGRMKSKRWVQASAPSYDGDEWGDDDYYEEEEEEENAPPMPQLPTQYEEEVKEVTSQAPLQLGTTAEKNAGVESPMNRLSLHEDTIPEYNEPTSPVSPSVVHVAEIPHQEEPRPEPKHEPVPQPQSEIEHKPEHEVEHEEPVKEIELERKEPVESVAQEPATPPNEREHEGKETAAEGEGTPSGQSDIDEIFEYYASSHEATPVVNEAQQVVVGPTEHHHQVVDLPVGEEPNGAIATKRLSSSSASLSTADPEPEPEIEAEVETGVEAEVDSEAEEEQVKKPVQGRWRPLPEAVVTHPVASTGEQEEAPQSAVSAMSATSHYTSEPQSAVSYTSQDRLEQEIMGSFSYEDDVEHLQPINEIAGAPRSRDSLGSSSAGGDGSNQLDPELAQLYQNTDNFMMQQPNHSVNDYSSEVEPLTMTKSNTSQETHSPLPDLPDMSGFEPHHDYSDDEGITNDAAQEEAKEEDEEEMEEEEPRFEAPETDEEEEHATGLTRESSIVSAVSNDQSEPVSPVEKSFQSMIIPETDAEEKQRERAQSNASAKLSPVQSYRGPTAPAPHHHQQQQYQHGNSKPPVFDFMAILSKGKPEDRKRAFDEARAREIEYAPGLTGWLQAAQQGHGSVVDVFTTGKPPAPSDKVKQLAAPQRTMSSTFIRPAKHIANSGVVNKVGEKSTKKAKSLFARGKRLIS